MQHNDISGNLIHPEKRPTLARRALVAVAVILFSFCYPVLQADAVTGPQLMCPDGSAPIKYGAAKSKPCTEIVDISQSIAVINHGLAVNKYGGNAGCPGGRNCATGFCPSYDCSSLSFYV